MEFKEIQDILKLVNKTDLTEVEIEKKDFKLTIRRKQPESNVIYTATQQASLAPATSVQPVAQTTPASSPAVEQAAPKVEKKETASTENDNYHTFKSPMIGTFYRASSPESEPFVKVGDYIEKGQVICIIEAMKLFNEIESEVEGKVVKIMLDNAQPVEYDQTLFIVDPNG